MANNAERPRRKTVNWSRAVDEERWEVLKRNKKPKNGSGSGYGRCIVDFFFFFFQLIFYTSG